MKLRRVPTTAEGNPLYPLPPDYYELTLNGQREARVNACRLWLLPTDDEIENARNYISSLDFFDRYYLWPDAENDFNPLFYDMTPCEPPEFHSRIMAMWANNRTTLSVCPRGSAKSMLVAKRIIRDLLTAPAYSITYSTSSHPNAEMTGSRVRIQLYENSRIFDDFSREPEFDGGIKPPRGVRASGTLKFELMNGSWFRGISAKTLQRGQRPRRYILDDPEFDPKASTSMDMIRAYMHELIHKIVLPMVQRPETGCDWMATFVSKRHYAYHAMYNTDSDEFQTWARLFVPAEYERNNKVVSCWPEMWPLNIAEKKEMAKINPKAMKLRSLEEIRREITNPIYLAEYLGRPGDADNQYFCDVKPETHGYRYDDIDSIFDTDPTKSKTTIVWQRDGQPVRKALDQFLSESRVFMTVDTSFTARKDSDDKACAVMALTPENELFVLDLWAQISQDHTFIRNIFKMADRWKAPTIHVETIKESYALYSNLDHIVKTKARDMAGAGHFPAIFKIEGKGTNAPKPAKISQLKTRFDHNLIKLPFFIQNRQPWLKFFDQLFGFNPDVENGGLAHDDCLDVVSMSTFVLKGRKARAYQAPIPSTDPLERLLAGELYDEYDRPLGTMVNWGEIPYDIIHQLITKEPSSDDPRRSRA